MRAKGFEKALQETNKKAKSAKTTSEQKEVQMWVWAVSQFLSLYALAFGFWRYRWSCLWRVLSVALLEAHTLVTHTGMGAFSQKGTGMASTTPPPTR